MPLPLVNGNHAVDRPPLRRPYETVVSHTHGMQRPVQFSLPEIQEILQFRKVRSKIIFLPDVELKQARMVGKVVMYLCSGQAIARHLQAELPAYRGGHFSSPPRLLPHMRRALSGWLICPDGEKGGSRSSWRKARGDRRVSSRFILSSVSRTPCNARQWAEAPPIAVYLVAVGRKCKPSCALPGKFIVYFHVTSTRRLRVLKNFLHPLETRVRRN